MIASRVPDLPAGSVAPVAAGPAYTVANALSYVFNPLVLPPAGFGLALWHLGAPRLEIIISVLVALAFYCLLPLAYIARLVKQGEASSLEIRQREHRTKPFLVGIACYALGAVVLGGVGETAVPLVVAMAALFPLNTAVVLLINLRWKMSVHLTGMAGFVSMLLVIATTHWTGVPEGWSATLSAGTVAPLLVLVPLLAWARVRVGAHTWRQAIAGALFGLVVPGAQLWALIRLLGLGG